MMKRKIRMLIAGLAWLLCLQCAWAKDAKGRLEVVLPEQGEGFTVICKKVQDERHTSNVTEGSSSEESKDGEEEAKNKDSETEEENIEVIFKKQAKNENIIFADLEEGIYEIEITGNEYYEFQTATVSIPAWDEEEHKMQYEVTLEPKYIVKPKPIDPVPGQKLTPQTGDGANIGLYTGILSLSGISLIILSILSCNRRRKCARMTVE